MSDAVLDMLYAVAKQAFVFLWHADRFYTGSIVCRYKPAVRHGEIITVAMPPANPYGERFTAYAEGVEHSVEVSDDGTVKMRTTITFTRGLFDEAER